MAEVGRRERHPVRIGALLWPQRTTWPDIREAILRADAVGLESLWTRDHLHAIVGSTSIGGRILVRTGRVAVLATTGAGTGVPRPAPVGFVARDDGTFLVGAGSPTGRGRTGNLTWGNLFVLGPEA